MCESNSEKSINPDIDFRQHGYPNTILTSKQLVYEGVLQNARDEYTLHGLPFQPREFWEKPMPEQLKHLKEAILELKLPEIAPAFHQNMGRYTDNKTFIGCGKASYPASLEKKFEEAVWNILSKDYKISFDDFKTSLRSALKPGDRLYTAPLLMHFTNKLVPRYEFYYKNKSDEPYKTLKYPSLFEVAIGTPDVGAVVYERKVQ